MVKLHQYESSEGYYLKTTYKGDHLTLQVTEEAEGLIRDLNYTDGDNISAEVLQPLIILEDAFTKSGKIAKADLLEGTPSVDPDRHGLTDGQKETLCEYLQCWIEEITDDYLLLKNYLNNHSHAFNQEWDLDVRHTNRDNNASKRDKSQLNLSNDLNINVENVPGILRELDQWICWYYDSKNGKKTKIPANPNVESNAKVDDPETWMSFEDAVNSTGRDDMEGIGFVFTDSDTIAGVDLDNVRDAENGILDEKAKDIINQLDSYTEISPSGTGAHVIVQGFNPPGRKRHNGVEMYDQGRYFTFTGEHLESTPQDVEVRQDALRSVHNEYIARSSDGKSDSNAQNELKPNLQVDPSRKTELEPDRVLRRAKHDDKFKRLWEGNQSGYPSHSEADMALCCSLAYRTGGDISLMDKLFRESGLMRKKWDEKRGDQTYGELTLQKAIQYVDEVDPYLVQENTQVTPISNLTPEETATVEAKASLTEKPPADEIAQSGRLMDQTRAIKFVKWDSEDTSDIELSEDEEYRLENVWVTTYEDHEELHINDHTKIENIS